MRRDRKRTSYITWLLLTALAVGLGWMYRGADLSKRPMHTDEAILAIKTAELMRTGSFEYDPHDYHGPLLHRVTQLTGLALGWTADTLDETKLRFITVGFGMVLLIIPLLLSDVLGRKGSGIAALLIAVSPMMTYYSRYYIMETPFAVLVSFFMIACWHWAQSKNTIWLVLAGVALGLMHATKETFVLNLAAMFAGWVVAKIIVGTFEYRTNSLSLGSLSKEHRSSWHSAAIVIGVGAFVSAAIFSNGFKDLHAISDSFTTYKNYLERASGSGHEKPWHYYLSLLFWRKNDFLWSEALIGGLAVLGMFNAFGNDRRPSNHRAFLIFLSVYSLALLVGYSILRYKTPWSILCVDHSFAMLAGVGMTGLFRSLEFSPKGKFILTLLFSIGLYHLCLQTSLAIDYSFATVRYSADPRNPYVYSHTSPNLLQLAKQMHDIAAKSPAGNDLPVQVIDQDQGWPLPWYLRDFTKVGYQATIPQVLTADLIVADLELDQAVRDKLKGSYESRPFGLRPGILLELFVKQELWDSYLGKPSSPRPAPAPVPTPATTEPSPAPAPAPDAPSAPEPFVGPPAPANMPPLLNPPPPRAEIVTDDEPAPQGAAPLMTPPPEGSIPKAKPAPPEMIAPKPGT